MNEFTEVLSPRREAGLRAVVEDYIAHSLPVGSLRVCNLKNLDISSATIRKEMLLLERLGLLSQPHVSAGRVPTEAGYRYFVDSLMEPLEISKEASRRIGKILHNARGELALLLDSLSSFLAELTCCAAVVVAPEVESARVRSVQMVELSSRVVLVVAVLSTGSVERRALEYEEPISPEVLASATEALSAALVSLPFGAEAAMTAPCPESQAIAERAAASLRASEGGIVEQVFVGGQSTVVSAFVEIEKISRMLYLFEQQCALIDMLRNIMDRGMQVAIGEETGFEPLADCSVVVSPYEVEGCRAGSVAVLGPTNMDYSTNLAAVSDMSYQLTRLLSGDCEDAANLL